MATIHDHCFFCCKYIPNKDNFVDENLKELLNSCEASNCKIKSSKTLKEYVLHISHYLKVPRDVIKENEKSSPKINICPDCTEISRNLSGFCIQLEVIRMKINYYLNLLTDQIIGISTDEYSGNKGPQRNISLSNLQRIVHKNCLLKVRKDEETSNPQICLQKCSVSKQNDLPEHTTTDTKLENSGPVNTCPFCDFLSSGPYEIIHSHIECLHPEQIQTGLEKNETSTCEHCGTLVFVKEFELHKQLCCSEMNQNVTTISKKAKCLKCEKEFCSQNTLCRHLRESASCGSGSKRKRVQGYKNRYECSSCNRRFNRRENLKRHLRKICKSGIFIDYGIDNLNDDMKDEPMPKFVKMIKFPCGYCPLIFNHLETQQRHIESDHDRLSEYKCS